MNAILHGASTCTPKKQASQLIVELGKSISNPQRQTLATSISLLILQIPYSTNLNKHIRSFVNV